MNKKHFLLLFTLICLCAGNAWGYTLAWQGESYSPGGSTSGDESSAEFRLYNAGTGYWLGHDNDIDRVPTTYSAKSKADKLIVKRYGIWGSYKYGITTQIGNSTYWLKSKDGGSSLSGTDSGNNTWHGWKTDKADRINYPNSFVIDCEGNRYMTAAGDGVRLKYYLKGDTANTKYNTWLWISETQFQNHDAYERFLTLKETIDNDGTGVTKYSSQASYSDFHSKYNVVYDITSALVDSNLINTAKSNLLTAYILIKVQYANDNKEAALEDLDGDADKAYALLASRMNGTIRTNLTNSIAAARTLTSAIGYEDAIAAIDAADITAAESDLAAKVAEAEASIAIYKSIDALVTRANAIVGGFDRSGQAGFNLNEVTTAYNNETITDGAAQKTLIYTRVQAAALRQTSLNADMSYALINPDFETGDMTGWNVTSNLAATKGVYTDATKPSAVGDLTNESGSYYFVTYDSSMDTNEGYIISQNVTLPAGSYELTVGIAGNTDANDNKINVYFDEEKVTKSKSEYSKTSLTDVSVSLTLPVEKTVTIKVTSYGASKVNSWFKCDNFRLKLTSARQTLLSGKASSSADASNYGMFYNENKVKLVDDAKAYVASWNYEAGTLILTELTNAIIPAETPVLVEYAASSTLTYTATEEDADVVTTNAFEIHNYSTSDGHRDYVLASHAVDADPAYNIVAFHRYIAEDESKINGKIVLVWTEPTPDALAPAMFQIVTENNTATALVPVYEDYSSPDISEVSNEQKSIKVLHDGKIYIQRGNTLYDIWGRIVR